MPKPSKIRHPLSRKSPKPHAKYVVEVFNINGFDIKPLESYVNANTKTIHQCMKCNNKWMVCPSSVVNHKSGCPKCTNKIPSQKEYNSRVRKASQNTVIPLELYNGIHTKIMHKCMQCNYKWKVQPSSVVNLKTKCPKCAGQAKPTQKEYESKVEKISNGNLKVLGPYIGAFVKIKHKCVKCSNKWDVTPDSITNAKSGCPNCCYSKNYSQMAIDCFEYISRKTVCKIQHAKNKGEYKINGYKIDGYIPELNIGIEFHGDYWHRKDWRTFVKSCVRDWDISKYLKLIVIWESDWKNNPYKCISNVSMCLSLKDNLVY